MKRIRISKEQYLKGVVKINGLDDPNAQEIEILFPNVNFMVYMNDSQTMFTTLFDWKLAHDETLYLKKILVDQISVLDFLHLKNTLKRFGPRNKEQVDALVRELIEFFKSTGWGAGPNGLPNNNGRLPKN